LFLNFGGPGGTSTSIFPGYAGLLSFGGFDNRFDLVTWDTRGTGGSAPLSCTNADLDAAADSVGLVDPSDGFDDELGDEREGFAIVVECASASGELLDNIGTVAVARDLELLRQAVGDDGLTYLGYSYGTEIGWVYASLFPDSVRALILDGVVDPVSQQSGFVDQYEAFERTLDHFDSWCAEVPQCDDLLSGERLVDAVDRVAAELAVQPLQLADGSTFDEERFLHGILSTLYLPTEDIGLDLAFWVNQTDFGDGSGLARFDVSSSLSPGVYEAVLCADGFRPQTEADAVQLYADFLQAAPRFGQLNEVLLCDMWPGRVDPIPELDTEGAPTILVVGNTFDPATPYEAAERLDAALDDSVLLTYDGAGHAIVGSDACIDGHAIRYLEDLVAPPVNTVC
jgi:pimeloyl-ACP methyl ester carboxylesterase